MSRDKRAIALVAGALMIVLMATPAFGGGAQVTTGEFEPLAAAAGAYDGVTGRAEMVRIPSGKTIVSVELKGLAPAESYGSHVHKQSCADGDGGGHYSFGYPVEGGAHSSGSEIWPGPITANAAGNGSGWTSVGDIAGAAAVSIVVHSPTGAKIACADLS